MSRFEAFVYCWKNTSNNKRYIGVHKGTLDDGYICSSKYMMEDYNPTHFTRQILASGSFSDMLKFESTLCEKVDSAGNETYYNLHNGNGDFAPDNMKGRKQTKKHVEKRFANRTITEKQKRASIANFKKASEQNKGQKRPDHAKLMKEKVASGELKMPTGSRFKKGCKHSAEHRRKISEAMRKRNVSIKK